MLGSRGRTEFTESISVVIAGTAGECSSADYLGEEKWRRMRNQLGRWIILTGTGITVGQAGTSDRYGRAGYCAVSNDYVFVE